MEVCRGAPTDKTTALAVSFKQIAIYHCLARKNSTYNFLKIKEKKWCKFSDSEFMTIEIENCMKFRFSNKIQMKFYCSKWSTFNEIVPLNRINRFRVYCDGGLSYLLYFPFFCLWYFNLLIITPFEVKFVLLSQHRNFMVLVQILRRGPTFGSLQSSSPIPQKGSGSPTTTRSLRSY